MRDADGPGRGGCRRTGVSVAVYVPSEDRLGRWVEGIAAQLPDVEVVAHDAVPDPGAVRHAVVWAPPPGMLARWPNLEATISIGAGIDHVAADPHYPAHVPVIKTVGDETIQRMREYVALHVLRMHRRQPELDAAQHRQEWVPPVTPAATSRPVGVLGAGALGGAAAATLAGLGFPVTAWSRSGAAPPGVRGTCDLEALLAGSEILVCLLPLTSGTRGILNAATLSRLPRGACLLNAARGGHVVEDDLLAALDAGSVGHATLDVTQTEPLPPDHPFWRHPRVTITPHVASRIDPVTGSRLIAGTLRALYRGAEVPGMTWIGRGY